MPYLSGVGRGEHGERDEGGAEEERSAGAEVVVGVAYGGRDEEGLADAHAADESVFELGGVWEGVVC